METEKYLVLDSWLCGERVRVEQIYSVEKEAQMFSMEFVDRKPPGLKRDRDMYSCHCGKVSILPEKGRWTFQEAEEEFKEWLDQISKETLEENPDRDLDLYLVEMFQYVFLHEKVRACVRGFPVMNCLTSFRGMVLFRHEEIATIFHP